MLTFAANLKKSRNLRRSRVSTGRAQMEKEDAASFLCPSSFDRAVMVAQCQWYDLRLPGETRESPQWSRDY